MDHASSNWMALQTASAELRGVELARTELPPHLVHHLDSLLSRKRRAMKEALAVYGRDQAAPDYEPDAFSDCDFCGSVVLEAVLADAGPELGSAVAGCMICPACMRSELEKIENGPEPTSFDDECGYR